MAAVAKVTESLHPRLVKFFTKYPPDVRLTRPPPPRGLKAIVASTTTTTSSADPNAPTVETSSPKVSSSETAVEELPYHNPFLPTKNFVTGKWYGPVYGLRKQADLVKLAQKYGVVNLLPWTIKKPEVKEQRRLERGLRVKGTGVGEKVKGKAWERTLKGRLEKRKQAMLDMPQLIQEWKQKGHGRGWKKWPK